jgi:DNA-directed RNA polymerase specialized sigma24 family protein
LTPEQLKEISEEHLVDLLVTKDRAALEFLYDNYAPALYGVIFRIVENKELAEKTLKDVFIKIFDKVYAYDTNKGKLFSWMLKICRQFAIEKSNKTTNKSYTELTSNQELDKLLKPLHPDQKQALQMIFFKGYTQPHLAQTLNISLGTLKTRLRSALLHLRKILNL